MSQSCCCWCFVGTSFKEQSATQVMFSFLYVNYVLFVVFIVLHATTTWQKLLGNLSKVLQDVIPDSPVTNYCCIYFWHITPLNPSLNNVKVFAGRGNMEKYVVMKSQCLLRSWVKTRQVFCKSTKINCHCFSSLYGFTKGRVWTCLVSKRKDDALLISQ